MKSPRLVGAILGLLLAALTPSFNAMAQVTAENSEVFGLKFGDTYEEAIAKGLPRKPGYPMEFGSYSMYGVGEEDGLPITLPNIPASTSILILYFFEENGLQQIEWGSKVIRDDERGSKAKESYQIIKSALQKKYATKPKSVRESAKWISNSVNFYSCLRIDAGGCGSWYAEWVGSFGSAVVEIFPQKNEAYVGRIQVSYKSPVALDHYEALQVKEREREAKDRVSAADKF